ncbi:MAG: hypothetical protein ABFD64_10145 [Armatimonadota bacterium]
MRNISIPLAVCVLDEPDPNMSRTVSYPGYMLEILDHSGVCYTQVKKEELADRLDRIGVLMTVGEGKLSDELKSSLESWVKAGGAWLAMGGVCGMENLLGVEAEQPAYSYWGGSLSTLGEGYLKPESAEHPILSHLEIPLHYFNGIPVMARGAEVLAEAINAHQQPTGRAALTEIKVGDGKCVLIAPDVTGSVVRIQQGVSVSRDGIPAPDGTSPVCDSVLKSDDGQQLDWIFDRQPVEGVPGFKAFLQPVADQWRELLLRAIFYLSSEQNINLPVLWLYPKNLRALGHLSHDSDGNDPDCALAMLDTMAKTGINSTWCVHVPGYPADILDLIRQAGHELAMHFDSMSPGTCFSEEEFDSHFKELAELFGTAPTTNKNHYLRWEGDTEFFEWCKKRGIMMDESKGASKTGEAGFNFGTMTPYRPITRDGRIIDVLELPTLTQDLLVFAPKELASPLIKTAVKHFGIVHFLYHPTHITKPEMPEAIVETVKTGRDAGLEWWTSRRIADWMKARRATSWTAYSSTDKSAIVKLKSAIALTDATLLWLKPGKKIGLNGKEVNSITVERWGFKFKSVVTNIEADSELSFECGG